MAEEINFILKSYYDNINYDLKFEQKITVITGDSGTGKSDLIRLLGIQNKEKLRIDISCEYQIEILNNAFFRFIAQDIEQLRSKFSNYDSQEYCNAMRDLLERYDNYLFFADEDFDYLTSKEFAAFCKFTDSYYVLISRSPLYNLFGMYTEFCTFYTEKQTNMMCRISDYLDNDSAEIKRDGVIACQRALTTDSFSNKHNLPIKA